MLNIIDWTPETEIKMGNAYRNMPSEVYHKHPALSNSGLKTLMDCPARYYDKYLSGREQKETPAFKIGKATHCYILEGSKAFAEKYFCNRYAKCLKSDLIAYLTAKGLIESEIKKYPVEKLRDLLLKSEGINTSGIELTPSEFNQIGLLARAIRQNELAYNAFKQKGESEISLFWQDRETGVELKCRPDWLPYDCLNIPDYKTCTSVNPEVFAKDFVKYGYHIQASFYAIGIKEVFGVEVQNFFFVAQEKEEPNISQVFLPDENLLNYGYKAIRTGINRLLECNKKGLWETYSNNVIEISLALKPDDLLSDYDRENSIVYLPQWIDREFAKYEG